MRTLAVAALAVLAAAAPAAAMPRRPTPAAELRRPPSTRRSRGAARAPSASPIAGRLVRGVQLPPEGVDFWTYDWGIRAIPNRPWRRWGTDRLVRTLLAVLREYRTANPGAPRVGVADLSRRARRPFGRNFGGLGHASHQNGLDVDIIYPRSDGTEARSEHRLVDPRSPRTSSTGSSRPAPRRSSPARGSISAARSGSSCRWCTTTTTCTSGSAARALAAGAEADQPVAGLEVPDAAVVEAQHVLAPDDGDHGRLRMHRAEGPADVVARTSRSMMSRPEPTESRSSSTCTTRGLCTA